MLYVLGLFTCALIFCIIVWMLCVFIITIGSCFYLIVLRGKSVYFTEGYIHCALNFSPHLPDKSSDRVEYIKGWSGCNL